MGQFIHILPWFQAVLACLLVALILLQRSEAGLGAAFGGDSGGAVTYTRRGAEKFIFQTTVIVAILFAASSLAILIIK